MPRTDGHRGRWFALVLSLAVVAGWVAFGWWLMPRWLEAAFAGRGPGFIRGLLEGRSETSLDSYLAVWAGIRVKVLLAVVVLATVTVGLAFLGGRLRRALAPIIARLFGLTPRVLPMPRVLLHALAFGLALGLLEFLGSRAHSMISGRPPWPYSPFATWLTPVANAVALVGLVVVLAPVLLRWPVLRTDRLIVFTLALMLVYPVLRVGAPGLFAWAAACLALGLATQLAAVAARRGLAFDRFMTCALVALGALVTVLFGVDRATRFARARSGLADAQAGLPNVLFLLLDTVRAQSLGLYGYERNTSPSLDQLAARSVVFENAIATSSWTLPSHVSLFTGRLPHETTASWTDPLDTSDATLAEILAANGYRTGAFFANLYFGDPYFGLDRGFHTFEAKFLTVRALVEDSWLLRNGVRIVQTNRDRWFPRAGQVFIRQTAADINERILEFTDGVEDRPFFVFANFFDAHDPFVPPPPFDTLFWPERPRGWYWPGRAEYTEEERAELTAAYDASIAYLDSEIGRLLRELEARGRLDNTLVIVVGDHGEEFGERGVVGHGNSLYLPTIRVPLILSLPGRLPAGIRIHGPVSIRDVPSTVLEILGLPARVPGESLARTWAPSYIEDAGPEPVVSELFPNPTDPNPPERYPLSAAPVRSLVLDDVQYIVNAKSVEEFFPLSGAYQLLDPRWSPRVRTLLPVLRAAMDSLKQLPVVPATRRKSK